VIAPRVLVGLVGYTPVVEPFPLGPALMARLEAAFAPEGGRITVENFSWSPIHVCQRFQDEGADRFDRLVLAGAAAVCRRPGRIAAYRWAGGVLPPAAVQDRVYEAVTGVVDLENTLVIGDHFGVWPDEVAAVEIDLPASLFGDLVQAEAQGLAEPFALALRAGFDVTAATAALAAAIVDCATRALDGLTVRTAQDLTPPHSFVHSRLLPRARGAAGAEAKP